jgi:hypothetical protein
MAVETTADKNVSYWEGELERAKKRFRPFWTNGQVVVDTYRQEKADGGDANSKDKYNILYSSTETIRPNLYAQSPIPRVELRSKDTATDVARVAALLLENCIKYVQKEEDFDEIMDSVVEDYLLPGMGTAFVRYEANVEGEELLDEMVKIEYVYWEDFLCGISRSWKSQPWVARRCWMTKEEATKRFGAEKARSLTYATRDTGREQDTRSETAEVWEIWDKKNKTVHWYADNQTGLLDSKPDPLKLKGFFPCPRPIRAIFNNRTFVPRSLYSQYKSQADTLNILTKRIRLLGEALKVTGLFDGSQLKLADILNPSTGNRMIAVEAWAQFVQGGGVQGAVQWVPIDDVVTTLNELLKAREVCKQEIYEITGFSDIVRGVSKASETLGAQNIKQNWAGARVKKMQAEIQRHARDLLALAGELIAEHCSEETLAVFSGMPIPTKEEVQANPEALKNIQLFKEACKLIRTDIRRVSVIDIETDSTLMADETAEREDRAKMLAAAGAFLQQAVPAMEATPELGPLLGAMLMFTVRSFPSARSIEDEFEKVQQALANRQPDPDKDGKKAEAAQKQAEAQAKQQELQVRQQESQAKIQAEQNRHAEKMAELALKQGELDIRKAEAEAKKYDAETKRFSALHEAGLAELAQAAEVENNVREYETEQGWQADSAAEREHKAIEGEADREHASSEGEANREAAAEAAQEAAESAPDGGKGGGEG